jgi:hypothetical protein
MDGEPRVSNQKKKGANEGTHERGEGRDILESVCGGVHAVIVTSEANAAPRRRNVSDRDVDVAVQARRDKRDDALLAAYYARNMVDMIRDGHQIGLRRVRSHECRDKVDLNLEARHIIVSLGPHNAPAFGGADAYHYYPVALTSARADVPEHLVRHVARDIAHGAGIGVAPYHGRARDVEHCERGSVRRVREVDEDPETIKFLDEHLAKPTVMVAAILAP